MATRLMTKFSFVNQHFQLFLSTLLAFLRNRLQSNLHCATPHTRQRRCANLTQFVEIFSDLSPTFKLLSQSAITSCVSSSLVSNFMVVLLAFSSDMFWLVSSIIFRGNMVFSGCVLAGLAMASAKVRHTWPVDVQWLVSLTDHRSPKSAMMGLEFNISQIFYKLLI